MNELEQGQGEGTHEEIKEESSKDMNVVSMFGSLNVLKTTLSVKERRLAVSLYAITTMLLFADQNILAPNLTAAGNEFGYTPNERDQKLGGDIAIAFFLVGAPASFVVGILADSDRIPRVALFAITILVGEGSCMATYWTTTYAQFYVTRALTGFSVGGALPLIYSLSGDLYAAEDRNVVSAMISSGMGLGIGFGQGISAWLGPRYGWRFPFLVVSTPTIFVAFLILWLVKDPSRGGMERAVLQHIASSLQNNAEPNLINELNGTPADETNSTPEGAKSVSHQDTNQSERVTTTLEIDIENEHTYIWNKWNEASKEFRSSWEVLKAPSVFLLLIQGLPGCLPWGIINSFLNDYLSEDKGMTIQAATLTFFIFSFGNFLGVIIAGAGGSYLYKRDVRYPSLLAGVSSIIAVAPMYAIINTIDSTTGIVYRSFVCITAGICSGVTGPIVKSTLLNVTLPIKRGFVFSLLNTFDDCGRGFGPYVIALMIQKLGRSLAFRWGILGWAVCGVLNASVFFFVANDEENVQTQIRNSLPER